MALHKQNDYIKQPHIKTGIFSDAIQKLTSETARDSVGSCYLAFQVNCVVIVNT